MSKYGIIQMRYILRGDSMTEDFKYLSLYIGDQIYKILKINLTDDSYIVLKNLDMDNDFYLNNPSLRGLIKAYSNSGYIHSDDKNVFNERMNVDFIGRHFLESDSEIDVWFRKKTNDLYKWAVAKIIKTPNYTDENKELYLFVQDNNIPTRLNIDLKLLDQYKILQAVTNIFIGVSFIDLESDTYINYRTIDEYKGSCLGSASADLKRFINNFIDHEFISNALDFTSLNLLPEKIKNKKEISFEAISKKYGWVRMSFFPISYDYNGNLANVVFAINVIDERKRREEELIKLSRYDVLTGVFNRFSYEDDLAEYKEDKNSDVIILADVNNLKYINDTYGHNFGDLLIKRAANCLNKVLSMYGKVYRTGGDEFVSIINISKIKVNDIIERINDEINAENLGSSFKLSISIGFSIHFDHQDKSIRELIQIADNKMYAAKEKYYKDNNICKYRS